MIKNKKQGLTLVEIMIATVVLTVAALAFVGAMGNITKSIYVSKSRSLANNLNQEKIESLKNISYYRLLVTTSVSIASESGLGSFKYDNGYYPPEQISIGKIDFERRVMIQKVSENSGNITAHNWYDQDTGLKLITSHVLWQQGNSWKKVTITNLRDNPDRQQIDASFSGTVESGGTDIVDATVVLLQNPILKGVSDTDGEYEIDVPAGTYDLKATKLGYFPKTIQATVAADGNTTVNFDLTEMDTGSISGTAYLNSHLVISEICAAVDGIETLEYVEIYNPTSIPFVINNAGTPSYLISYSRTSGGGAYLNSVGQTTYNSNVIPANGYFLFASSPSVNGVTADAYYNTPANLIPIIQSGGVAILSQGVYDISGSTIDAIGWGNTASPYGPSNAREGNGFQLVTNPGLDGNEVFERLAYSTSNAATMITAVPGPGDHEDNGNALDTNVNSDDFVFYANGTTVDNDVPQNTSVTEAPGSGTPARQALIFSDDGLSSTAIGADSPAGEFSITNVATGTWNILASSSGWVANVENIVVTNGVDSPQGNVLLSTPASGGFASGRVVDSGGSPLDGILVDAVGETDFTDSNGYFRLLLDVDTYTVTANPNNYDSQYTIAEATGVVVNLGQITTISPDITLREGGIIQGWVTSNGTDALPGIPIIATDTTGAEIGSTISDYAGNFSFASLPVGNYTFSAQLEIGESASPTNIVTTAVSATTVFAGTFTVSNSFGRIEGTVKDGSSPITTGTLIIAVPSSMSIGPNPPTIDNTLRNGTTYYYIGTSDSDGQYSLSVRGGINYNIYAWYTTFVNNSPATIKKTDLTTVAAGGSTTLNFSW